MGQNHQRLKSQGEPQNNDKRGHRVRKIETPGHDLSFVCGETGDLVLHIRRRLTDKISTGHSRDLLRRVKYSLAFRTPAGKKEKRQIEFLLFCRHKHARSLSTLHLATSRNQKPLPTMQGGPMPGQMPSPEQIAAMQRQIAIDAEKAGMTVPQFIEHLKRQAMEQQQAHMEEMQRQQAEGGHSHGHDHQHPHQQGQPQPILPGPPNPVAIALANFLRSQDLKPRTCILNGERKDMFKGKLINACSLTFCQG